MSRLPEKTQSSSSTTSVDEGVDDFGTNDAIWAEEKPVGERLVKQHSKNDRPILIEKLQLVLWPDHQHWVAIGLLAGLMLLAATWGMYRWQSGGVVDIETAEKLEFQFQVDLNSAAWNELFAIPGIGETMARRIVAFRETEGPYHSIDELVKVHGVGSKTVARLRPFFLPID